MTGDESVVEENATGENATDEVADEPVILMTVEVQADDDSVDTMTFELPAAENAEIDNEVKLVAYTEDVPKAEFAALDTDNVVTDESSDIVDNALADNDEPAKAETNVKTSANKAVKSVRIAIPANLGWKDCDFNEDGNVDFKDLTYLFINLGRKAVVIDNLNYRGGKFALLTKF